MELRSILEAMESLPEATELEAEVVAELSMTLLRTGEPEESLALVERRLALLPDDPSRQARTRAMLLLAEVSSRRNVGDVSGASAATGVAYAYTTRHLERGDVLRLEAIATGPDLSLDDAVAELEAAVGTFETMGHADMAGQAQFLLDQARAASDS